MGQCAVELELIIRNHICASCSERTTTACGTPSCNCALFGMFHRVVQAVEQVNSENIRDYQEVIRRDICSVCATRLSDGNCVARDRGRCALESSLVSVVDIIEEATGKKLGRAGFTLPKTVNVTGSTVQFRL